jgi:hypothetical protein
MNARTLTILAALAAAAAGCVPNDASIRMFGLCSPPTPSAEGGCLYPTACETLALGRLQADVASTSPNGPLVWPVQIDNQRPSNADRAEGVETAYANIHGYRIKYGSATLAIPEQDAPAIPSEHTINPGGSTVVLVPIVNRAAGTFLAGQVLAGSSADISAEVRAYGQYGDGSSFETGPFTVQATLCNGCIPAYSTNPTLYCSDPANPVLLGVCPQQRQSATVSCTAAAVP